MKERAKGTTNKLHRSAGMPSAILPNKDYAWEPENVKEK
jgi:hypothetical protein